MNRAFLIITIPAAFVLVGYIVVLRHLGIAPGYFRLAVVGAGFLTAFWLVHRRGARKAKSSAK
jgi:ABC-type glycerol-3-phosphate transport system permease component